MPPTKPMPQLQDHHHLLWTRPRWWRTFFLGMPPWRSPPPPCTSPSSLSTLQQTQVNFSLFAFCLSLFINISFGVPGNFQNTSLLIFLSSLLFSSIIYDHRSRAESRWDRETAAGKWKGSIVARRTARERYVWLYLCVFAYLYVWWLMCKLPPSSCSSLLFLPSSQQCYLLLRCFTFFSSPGMSDLSIGGYGGYGAGGRVEFDMFSASPSGIEQTLGVGKKGQAVGESMICFLLIFLWWHMLYHPWTLKKLF